MSDPTPEYEVALERNCESYAGIICPYCGHSHRKEPEDVPWNDDEEAEFTCNLCGKEFICRAWSIINWTTEGKDTP